MYRKRDLFDPDMLVRHLRGYEPAQSELNRFANDPVRVHFAHGHVAALAGVYDFDLMCGLRRLDAPEAQEPDTLLVAELQLPTTAAYMSGPEKLIAEAYLKSPCGLAPPGSGVAHARPAHPQHLVRGVRAREVEERERRGRTDPPKRVIGPARRRRDAPGAASMTDFLNLRDRMVVITT